MSKKLIALLISIIFCYNAGAQWVNKSFIYDSQTRSYRVYTAPNYNPANPASLVITLHGLGDNMTNFSTALKFNYIADTANIVIICPQAISDAIAGTAWNSGAGFMGYYPNSTVDDVGFINALVDTTKANYSIDSSKVYLCGFSMGGFMTERMALQSNSKFAAFASMSGTIGSGITSFNPGRPIRIAHFHGTSDATVAFSGNSYGVDADSLINFWVLNNGGSFTHDSIQYLNTVNDNITVDRFKYSTGNPDNEVWFFRMNGADHTILYKPTNDITEIYEMWLFFRNIIDPTAGIYASASEKKNVQVYPNPAADFINVILPETSEKIKVEIYSVHGALVYSAIVQNSFHHISLDKAKFHNGMYLIRVSGASVNYTQQIIIQK
ncbi:MAG: PHB depolymerase family esterase [Bacteroidales bacterium]|jgi:polyhydroxybutyrate depolymerase|nr:T9SS type A sorting domain-containing protein [Bacteroidales bacterium]MDD4213630.1 PHB depolymerase family esterase [Bacteroidales bacterium]